MAAPSTGIRLCDCTIRIGPRPKKKSFAELKDTGVTHLVTILGESEGAAPLISLARKAGLTCRHLPFGTANITKLDPVDFAKHIAALFTDLQSCEQATFYMHCSAGIHRTGMVTYALIRLSGLNKEDALQLLDTARAVTAEGVTDSRLDWIDHEVLPRIAT